ncbi:MAG: ArsB/NhaD family transporter [Brevinematia bacterium]
MSISSIIALIIFILVYIIMTGEIINKTIIALIGGVLIAILKIIPQEKIFEFVDWNVIFLLIGMMIIVGITKHTGLFQFVAIKAAKIARGNPITILILLVLITAVFSAFLDNVTTILILTPVTILIAVELGISPVPFIISESISSNIGGTATLIGDPPNIMIGSAAGLDFNSFITNLTPVIIIILITFIFIIYMLFSKKMHVSNERKSRIMDFEEKKSITDKKLLIKSLFVLGITIIGFILHGVINVEPSVIALGGASLLMLLSGKHEVESFFVEIEWGTVFFFIGLFILIGGLVETGLIKKMAEFVLSLTKGNIKNTSILILWASGIFSALVDNIPYVATMIPMIKDIGVQMGATNINPLWWSLALGACLGGNGTLIGASANVVASGIAGKSGYKISFMEFTKYGAIITIISLIISTAYIYLRYFIM